MALAEYAIPFGLRQVKLVPLKADGTEDTAKAVFLPASRTFSFSENEDFETLEGDDRTIASHGAGPKVEWELEGGGISLAAWAVLSGGSTATSGTTPAAVKTYTKLNTESRPYFNVYGRAISDNGGDFEAKVFRCKADSSIEGSMENGSFQLTSASGTGYGNDTDGKLYTFTHRETAVPLTLA
ncbi:major tail protein [Microbacterium phage Huwbert]|nr:major tail protein [Microbacterium phage Huwbert]